MKQHRWFQRQKRTKPTRDRVLKMKNSISGLFLLLFLSTIGSGLTSVVSKHYTYSEQYYTWEEARNSCTNNFQSNLATFYAQSDVDNVVLNEYHTWISLNINTSDDRDGWNGCRGSRCERFYLNIFDIFDLFKTKEGKEKNVTEVCAAVNYDQKTIEVKDCEDLFFFLCEDNEENQTYTFIPEARSWSDARLNCGNKGYDLARFKQSNQDNFFVERDFPVWIGLYRDGASWNWSTGFSWFVNLTIDESSNVGDCVSISSLTKKMAAQNCDAHFPFLCITENVVLVKENKSWEEALEYCQTLFLSNYSDLRFDLLSIEPGDDHVYVMKEVIKADTEEVWTGLRFLAGEWLWVNGEEMLYPDLPLCPITGHFCGALLQNDTGSVEPRDCLEQKNFLCYSYS